MKKFALFLCLFISVCSYAQIRFEGELGGSNFLGYSLNVEPSLWTSPNSFHQVSVKLGAGGLFPGWPSEPTLALKGGLSYYYKSWSLGIDGSTFSSFPLAGDGYYSQGMLDLLVYPHVGYSFHFKNKNYLKLSAGVWIPFDRSTNYQTGAHHLEYIGDAMPGIGISWGGIFKK